MVDETIAQDGRACTKCGEFKPWSEFWTSRRDGVIGRCKDCTRAYQRGRRSANRERYNAKQRSRSSPSYKGPPNVTNVPVETNEGRLCTKCDRRLPRAQFSPHPGCVGGLTRRCKECARRQHAEWRERNREHVRATARAAMDRLRHRDPGRVKSNEKRYRFRLSWAEIQAMRESQGNRCLICRVELSDSFEGNKRACVDHCHATKKVRGILCNACNTAIGMLKDSPEIALAAAEYLRMHADDGCPNNTISVPSRSNS